METIKTNRLCFRCSRCLVSPRQIASQIFPIEPILEVLGTGKT